MANHVRRQLREAVATALTGLTTTGSRVYPSRVFTVEQSNLPCLAVYVKSGLQAPATMDNEELRSITVIVEGLCAIESGLDDLVDQISKEVEAVLGSPISIGSFTTQLVARGFEIEMRDDLNIPVGSIALTFTAELFTSAPDVITGA